MTINEIPDGDAVFVDANVLVYHFTGHPQYGHACTRFVERIERRDIQGFTSSHCLADVAHRLMTIEAMHRFGWPVAGLAARLRRHRSEIAGLQLYRQAVGNLTVLGLQTLSITKELVLHATELSQQHQLLTGDALIVAAMRDHNLVRLASHDSDFDAVPAVTRYAPG